MERNFKDGVVRQNHKTAWFNATDLNKIANSYRSQIGLKPRLIADYLKKDSTKEFVKEILNRENISKAFETKTGINGGTWVHPLVLIDFAMWLSPAFKYEAMKWLEDELLKNRDNSGDSYKKLCSVVKKTYDLTPAKVGLVMPQIATKIKEFFKVDDWNKATDKQLKLRDTIQNNLSLLLSANVEINKAIELILNNIKEEL